jgi:hypothetical protein
MAEGYDTGMELLAEAAHALEVAGGACEAPEDAAEFMALAVRVRDYLAVSRPTTTLGMPRIPPSGSCPSSRPGSPQVAGSPVGRATHEPGASTQPGIDGENS